MTSPIDILPKEKYDSIHYKLINRLENFIDKKNHPNMIISGKSGSGKTTIVKLLFKDLFNSNKVVLNYGINYDVYYYFDCKNIVNKNEFIDTLKSISKTIDYSDKHKYIILDSFEKVSDYIQNCLKVIIEKSSNVTKFIIICNNSNFIIKALRSRCINISIKEPKYYDKYIYLKKKFNDNNILFNEFLLLKNCRVEPMDKIISNHLSNDKYKDIEKLYVNKIIEIFYNPFSLKEIKSLSQTIKELNISHILEKELINKLQLITTKKKIMMIIKEIARYNHNIKNSYRDILFLEALLIRLYNIINELL